MPVVLAMVPEVPMRRVHGVVVVIGVVRLPSGDVRLLPWRHAMDHVEVGVVPMVGLMLMVGMLVALQMSHSHVRGPLVVGVMAFFESSLYVVVLRHGVGMVWVVGAVGVLVDVVSVVEGLLGGGLIAEDGLIIGVSQLMAGKEDQRTPGRSPQFECVVCRSSTIHCVEEALRPRGVTLEVNRHSVVFAGVLVGIAIEVRQFQPSGGHVVVDWPQIHVPDMPQQPATVKSGSVGLGLHRWCGHAVTRLIEVTEHSKAVAKGLSGVAGHAPLELPGPLDATQIPRVVVEWRRPFHDAWVLAVPHSRCLELLQVGLVLGDAVLEVVGLLAVVVMLTRVPR
mmetsp:Transcript_33296/g.82479  ORF Transcript_33296/g.82479 Transcript_33296/m.82479 type:complete len:337 (-) Transcript_33296:108-1118(-)